MNYDIKTNEPEGWQKAFEVTKDGVHVAWFRFRDTAEHYVSAWTTQAQTQAQKGSAK